MKFNVTMKTPDALDDAIHQALQGMVEDIDCDGCDKETMIEEGKEAIDRIVSKWFSFGEYLTVEIDTEAGTCTVMEK